MDERPFHPFGAFKSKVLEHGALYDFLCKWGNTSLDRNSVKNYSPGHDHLVHPAILMFRTMFPK